MNINKEIMSINEEELEIIWMLQFNNESEFNQNIIEKDAKYNKLLKDYLILKQNYNKASFKSV